MPSRSSFPACFRPSTNNHHIPPSPPPPPTTSGDPDLTTTCLYHTELGLFSLTWSRSFFFGHSLRLHLHPPETTSCSPLSSPPSFSSLYFHLHIKPFIFWKKHGSKKLHLISPQDYNASSASSPKVQVFWDLSRAKFGTGPEPESGFYVAVVVERETVLLVGDLTRQALAKTKARKQEINQVMVLRREHVYGNKVYSTKARFGGKIRDITIDCNNDAKLSFSVDNKRVLQIKRLKWKFRGNERIEVDGVCTQISWDVYNWLFEDVNNGHAVFMFRFESTCDEEQEQDEEIEGQDEKNGVVSWEQSSFGGVEWRKTRRRLMRTARSSSSSSISMSSASSGGGSSSIMEWASTEENELNSTNGFSLVVYAWRKRK